MSELAARIDAALRSGVATSVQVRGEVSGFRERTHWYFDLKDDRALIGCVMFASNARRSRLSLADGQSVVARGRVEYYVPQGRVTLIVDSVQPDGRGLASERLAALIAELRGLGWMDESRKRALPVLPRRVVVVTSRTAAALADVRATMRSRCPSVELLLADAPVQGEAAASELARTVRAVSRASVRLGVDAVLITRGGGSPEDLWCFNDRELARAIVECAVPVVAAIGHETDVTVAELVADRRASTPTQAAMMLTPDRDALGRQVGDALGRLDRAVRGVVAEAWERVDSGADRLLGSGGADALARRRRLLDAIGSGLATSLRGSARVGRARLDRLVLRLHSARGGAWARGEAGVRAERLGRLHATLRAGAALVIPVRGRAVDAGLDTLRASFRRRVERASARLDVLEARLAASNPVAVLERGFSITTDMRGRAIRSARAVEPGQVVVTRVADGRFESQVRGDGHAALAKGRSRRDGTQGPGLFGEVTGQV